MIINFYWKSLSCKRNWSKQSPEKRNNSSKVEGTRLSNKRRWSLSRLGIVWVTMRRRFKWRPPNTVSMTSRATRHSREEPNTLSSSSSEFCHNMLDCNSSFLKFISLFFLNVVLDYYIDSQLFSILSIQKIIIVYTKVTTLVLYNEEILTLSILLIIPSYFSYFSMS